MVVQLFWLREKLVVMVKIGYVTFIVPSDRRSSSGTVFKMREAIEAAGFEVVWIPYHRVTIHTILHWIILTARNVFGRKKWLRGEHYEPIAKGYAKSIDKSLIQQCDYLFFPFAGQIYPFLDTDVPSIYFSDATTPLMINYYFRNLSEKSIRMASLLDQQGCAAAYINIRSSHWALDSTIKDCGGNPDRCFVLEFGANIDKKDIIPVEPYNGGPLNILFSGVDWERKGGDIAVETVQLLRDKGIDAHLIVAGPKSIPNTGCGEFVEFVGFLDKNDEADYKRYVELFRRSHLFLLPTKAECSAIVFCEAAAFGLPCYTYDTGGTSNYVINSVNGYALPEGSSAKVFAEHIYHDIHDDNLRVLRDGALKLSKERLSWDVWSKGFKKIMG